jgi:hypothetical protein
MVTKKTAKKPVEKPAGNYLVVVAEYDENGSDGLCVDNALGFDTPKEAAKFIAEDFNDTIAGMVETGDIDDNEMLDEKAVLKKVKKLKIEENAEWDTPEDTPVWVKWKIFRKG